MIKNLDYLLKVLKLEIKEDVDTSELTKLIGNLSLVELNDLSLVVRGLYSSNLVFNEYRIDFIIKFLTENTRSTNDKIKRNN